MNDKNDKSVSVALCTYNGERYLSALLDSLACQQLKPAELIACDDGSTDSTISILNEFKSRAPFNVRIILNEKRMGVIRNFEKALTACSCEYIALCDQDDIWKPEKLLLLTETISRMQDNHKDGPFFVHSDIDLVDDNSLKMGTGFLEHQGLKPPLIKHYRTLIVQNYIPGCSALFSADLLTYALPFPAEVVMHDWWLALIASIAGKIDFEPSKVLLYRQHTGNQLGSEPRFSWKTGSQVIRIYPAIKVMQQNFICAAKQAIAARNMLSGKNVCIPAEVSNYVESLTSSKMKILISLFSGHIGRANFIRNLTLILAVLGFNTKSLRNLPRHGY